MSVLIKGMGMPKSGEHPYWVAIHSDGIVEFNENKGQGWQTSEAVPVPPHGRVIDADALMKKIEHDTPMSAVFEKTIRRYLHNAPTIIPAEPPKDEAPTRPYDLLYEEGGYGSSGV